MKRSVLLAAVTALLVSCALAESWDWDHARALHYASLAQASFCPRESVAQWKCQHCQGEADRVHTLFEPVTNTFGFVAQFGDELVVSFRGSIPSIRNFLTDADATKTPAFAQDASVHTGFLSAFRGLQPQLHRAVQSVLGASANAPSKNLFATSVSPRRIQHITVTGHSLGAALATLAALDLSLEKQRGGLGGLLAAVNVRLISFGSPRVGNARFAQLFNRSVPQAIRVVNQKDIVAHVPPRFLGFFHVNAEVLLENDAGDRVSHCVDEGSRCANRFSFFQYSQSQHKHYFNMRMGHSNCSH